METNIERFVDILEAGRSLVGVDARKGKDELDIEIAVGWYTFFFILILL